MRILAIVALLGCSSVSFAGVVMQMEDKDLQSPNDKPKSQIYYFQDGAFRQEQAGDGDISVFRNQVMYTLDTKNKTFRKIDKAQMDKMGEQLAGMRAKMEAQMKNMPPAQRQMMEQAMGNMGAAKKEPVVGVRDTGRSEAAAGIACRIWEVSRDGKKETEVCAAAPGSIPGGADMMKSMREMGGFVSGLSSTLGGKNSANGYWSQLQKINGVPVIAREFDAQGKPESEQRVVAMKSSSLPAAMFEVPAGYTEKKLPGFGPGAAMGSAEDDDK